MTIVIVVGLLLTIVLPILIGLIEARQAPHWRQVAADRRRAWETAHLRDDNPTGPQPVGGRR